MKRGLIDIYGHVPQLEFWPSVTIVFRSVFSPGYWSFYPGTHRIGKDILLLCGLWVHGFRRYFELLRANIIFWPHKEVIRDSSGNRAEYAAAAPPFPNLHFNPEMMTGANSELVDVSQRGQTSPSVSIIAARQVSLSHPHGEPPSWIRGDAPLPLWPLKPQGGNSRIWHCFNDLNSQNIIS